MNFISNNFLSNLGVIEAGIIFSYSLISAIEAVDADKLDIEIFDEVITSDVLVLMLDIIGIGLFTRA